MKKPSEQNTNQNADKTADQPQQPGSRTKTTNYVPGEPMTTRKPAKKPPSQSFSAANGGADGLNPQEESTPSVSGIEVHIFR